MAGVSISTSSGQYMPAGVDADLPRDWDSAKKAQSSQDDSNTDDDSGEDDLSSPSGRNMAGVLSSPPGSFLYPKDTAGSFNIRNSSSSGSSSSDDSSDSEGGTDNTVSPPRPRQRRKRRGAPRQNRAQQRFYANLSLEFRRRVDTEMFWEVRDDVFRNIPLSLFFIKECVGTCDYKVRNAYDFILPAEAQRGAPLVPTRDNVNGKYLFVGFKEPTFYLALQKLRENLKPAFNIKYFTLPFTLPLESQGNDDGNDLKLGEHVAHRFNNTHAEALKLFVVAVHRMTQVIALLQDADSKSTAAKRQLYNTMTASTRMETVRQNMWILNNRFAYDKNIGGFYRVGARKNKGAIALLSSMAAASAVNESASTVRSSEQGQKRRWQYARPQEKENDVEKAPTAEPEETKSAGTSTSDADSGYSTPGTEMPSSARTPGAAAKKKSSGKKGAFTAKATPVVTPTAVGGEEKSPSPRNRKRQRQRRSRARRMPSARVR